MDKVLPTLDTDGFVHQSQAMLDYLLSYYILTDAAQSILFKDSLISLPKTYAKYIDDADGFAIGIKSDLNVLLQKYFKIVDVQTSAYKNDKTKGYYVVMSASVIDDNNHRYDVSKVTYIYKSKSLKIFNFNNYAAAKAYVDTLISQ
jgi:hypothetical protein